MLDFALEMDDLFDSFIPVTKKRNTRLSCSQSTISRSQFSTFSKQKTLNTFFKPKLPKVFPLAMQPNSIISSDESLSYNATFGKNVLNNQSSKLMAPSHNTIGSDTFQNGDNSKKITSSDQSIVSQNVPPDIIDFCPTCQVPFKSLNVQPCIHAVTCQVNWKEMEECFLGENCNADNAFHYRDYAHQKLAHLRSSKRKLETPTANKFATPVKRPYTSQKSVPCNESTDSISRKSSPSPVRKYSVDFHPLNSNHKSVLLKAKTPESDLNVKTINNKALTVSSTSTCILDGHEDVCISPTDMFDQTTVGTACSVTTLSEDFNVEQALNLNLQTDLSNNDPKDQLGIDSKSLSFKGNIIYKGVEKNSKISQRKRNNVIRKTLSGEECICNKSTAVSANENTGEIETCVQMTLSPPSKECASDVTLRSPVKVQLQYNELGWRTLGIDLQPHLSMEEVKVSVCDCSYCMQVECTITNPKNSLCKKGEARVNTDGLQSKIFVNLDDVGLQNGNVHNQSKSNNVNKLQNREMSIVSSFNSNGGSSTSLAVSVPKVSSNQNEEKRNIIVGKQNRENSSSVTSALIQEENDKADLDYSKNAESKEKWKELMGKMQSKGLSTMSVMSDDSLTVPAHTSSNASTYGNKGWRNNGRKQCPFYKIIPDTRFVVDAFQYGTIPGISHYFLTHFHSDHYGGLRKSFQKPIICSPITATLVKKKLRVESRYLNVIELENPIVIHNVTITALEANHCPGSVMFLFQLLDGRNFLHVGDFRADPTMESYACFWNLSIDKLFLDTTYCNPRYTFPTQSETVAKVIDITKEHLQKYPQTLIVSGTYTIGKEKVFMGIAEALDCKVWAKEEKRKVLECLRDASLTSRLVDYPWEARVHVWSMMDLNPVSLQRHVNQCKGKFKQVLAFKPSGWELQGNGQGEDFKSFTTNNVTICGVPYSEHSSFTELQRFVQFLKPTEIVPTVNMGSESSRAAMQRHFKKWLSEPPPVANQIQNQKLQQQQKLTSFLTTSKTK